MFVASVAGRDVVGAVEAADVSGDLGDDSAELVTDGDDAGPVDYLLVAAVVLASDLDEVRRAMRELVLPGQRRVHMKREREQRKKLIAATVCDLAVQATVYDAGRGRRSELDARAACLRALVVDAAARRDTMLVLDQDDSVLAWDRRQLYATTREIGVADLLRYEHRRAATDPLLAVPDAIAWCWAKGGEWRRRIEPVIATVRDV